MMSPWFEKDTHIVISDLAIALIASPPGHQKDRKPKRNLRPAHLFLEEIKMASIPATVAPTTLPHFLKLPREIQDIIWDTSLFQLPPRFVHVQRFGNSFGIKARSRLPSLFAVSQHSRALAMKYTLQLLLPHFTPHIIFFNPEIDILLFREFSLPRETFCSMGSGHRIQDIISVADLGRVKTLCIVDLYQGNVSCFTTGPVGDIPYREFILNCGVFKSVEVLAFGTNHIIAEMDFLFGGHESEPSWIEQSAEIYNLFVSLEGPLWERHVNAFPRLKLRVVRFSPMRASYFSFNINYRGPLVGPVGDHFQADWTFKIGERRLPIP